MRKRVALVTGVLGGLGKVIAAELSKNGVRVIITDLPGEDLNKTSSDLGLVAIGADLGRESSVSSFRVKAWVISNTTRVIWGSYFSTLATEKR